MLAHSSMKIARKALCLLLLAGVTACAGARETRYPIPDDPGIYALTGGDNLRRLDGDRDWEAETWPDRSDMPSNVQFVIYDPALAGRSAGSAVELWRVPWVRSEIDAQGQAMPVQGSEWAVAPLEPYAVPFRYESPPGQTEVVHVVPSVPLAPGLYAVRITNPGARQARVGVNWNSIDQRQYSALNCVDRYSDNVYRPCSALLGGGPGLAVAPAAGAVANTSDGGLASLPPPQPAPTVVQQPPAQPVAAPSAEGLQIGLTDPIRRNDGLVIQGSVTNTSNQIRTLPTLQGSLEDAQGQAVRRWEFQPPVATLGPGERTTFSTEVRPIPAGTARASVAFIISAQ